jgi:hypothetical protein
MVEIIVDTFAQTLKNTPTNNACPILAKERGKLTLERDSIIASLIVNIYVSSNSELFI